MVLLGLDYGAKKIGLAKAGGKIAVPLKTMVYDNQRQALAEIKDLCQDESVERIIVGVPISLRAEMRDVDYQNKHMQEVLAFIEQLKKAVGVPVETEDERMSTKMANGHPKELVKQYGDDALAAAVILQSYLDRTQR